MDCIGWALASMGGITEHYEITYNNSITIMEANTMSDEQDIILADLSDEELTLQMHDDLYDGMKEEIEEGVNILLGRGWMPYDVLTKALVEGMRIVGIDFRDGILFVPEVLLAANAMKGGMAILKPLLAETGAPRLGNMLRCRNHI